MPKKKIKEDKQKNTNKQDQIEEIVDNIYDGSEDARHIDKPLIKRGSRLVYVAVLIIIGFLSGVLGELSINNYLSYKDYNLTSIWQPQIAAENDDSQIIVFKKEEVAQNNADQIKTLLDSSAQAVVGIYVKRGGDSVVDQLYQPRDKVGNALVMTSDGWLATTVSGMPSEEGRELVVISEDHKILPIKKIVLDDSSQIVFLKVEAESLKVIKFASNDQVYPGLPVLVLGESLSSESIQSVASSLEKVRYRPITGFADYFSSSERYSTWFATKDKISKDFVGGPVIDMEGGIIGLYAGLNSQNLIIPAEHFLDAFDQLLRLQEINRPYLGVRYIDLSIAFGLNSSISEDLTQGALIFGDKDHRVTAVYPNSPAEKAGLEFGDIILKVNDDPVDARHSLTELLQQYEIGDVVKLVVQNSGVVREVEVGLVEEVSKN